MRVNDTQPTILGRESNFRRMITDFGIIFVQETNEKILQNMNRVKCL